MNTATDTIHGYEVLMSTRTPGGHGTRAGRVVLVDKGPHEQQRYVTGWQGDGDDEWHNGHYFALYSETRADFSERVTRAQQPIDLL